MMTATFRRNRQGEWTVFGPATLVVASESVRVQRADGSVRNVYISTVSRSFDVNGTPYVYGTIGQAPRREAAAPRSNRRPEAPSFGAPVQMSYAESVAADEAAAEAEAESSEFSIF